MKKLSLILRAVCIDEGDAAQCRRRRLVEEENNRPLLPFVPEL